MIAYFLCPETLTALLLLSRQAGGYQDVVKVVGLEPAIKLAKTVLPRARSGPLEASISVSQSRKVYGLPCLVKAKPIKGLRGISQVTKKCMNLRSGHVYGTKMADDSKLDTLTARMAELIEAQTRLTSRMDEMFERQKLTDANGKNQATTLNQQHSATIASIMNTLERVERRLSDLAPRSDTSGIQDRRPDNYWERDRQVPEFAQARDMNSDRDLGIKVEVPKFDGKQQPDAFLDWLLCIENIFSYRPMTEENKVALVATRFRGFALTWWAEVQRKRRMQNLDPVSTWERMNELLKTPFLPLNDSQVLFDKFQDLRQGQRCLSRERGCLLFIG